MKPGSKGGERIAEMPSIYRTFQGFDALRSVGVRGLEGEAATTVVPLRTPSGHLADVPGGAAFFDDALPELTQERRPALAHRRVGSTPWMLATRAAAVLLLSFALPLATVGSDPPPADAPARAVLVADAGQEAQIHGAPLQLKHRTLAELQTQAAWAKGWLTFHGEPLFEVVHTINQHNRRQLVIADPSIAQLPVGGRFLATDLEALIKALTAVLPVRVLPNRGISESNIVRLARAEKSPVSSPSRLVPARPHT